MDAELCPLTRYLRALHARFQPLASGRVATYIPELARADPNGFGLALATVDGHVYEVGDARIPFTIQSISKPFVYGLALEDRGKPEVLRHIGVEPTGDAFNEISLEGTTGRPRNPMINAGAITATSLVLGDSLDERWSRILGLLSLYAGRPLALDQAVLRSESETGHRNRAIGHMLRNAGILERDPEPDLELYFRQCSVRVDCRDLAVMGATLAAGGTNPVTRERVLRASNVDEVLSVMTTCGMYDYAGEWVYRVGLPAKSGVGGGLLAVLPGQLGIAVWSPPLDERGNSVRGVAVCEALSEELALHFLRAPRPALSAVRSRATLRELASKRLRTAAEEAVLAEHGDEAAVLALQGDLGFAGVEAVIRRVVGEAPTVTHIVLDLARATAVDPTAARLVLELDATLAERGRHLVFVGLAAHPRLLRGLEEASARGTVGRPLVFDELDAALEACEDAVLAAHGMVEHDDGELPLARHDLLRGLDGAQLELLGGLLERRRYAAHQTVVDEDDPSDELFLLVQGALSVRSQRHDGGVRRLATLSPGMAFGETSLIEGGTRTATVRADRASICLVLKRASFESLGAASPETKIRLLESLLRSSSRTIGRLSRELASVRRS